MFMQHRKSWPTHVNCQALLIHRTELLLHILTILFIYLFIQKKACKSQLTCTRIHTPTRPTRSETGDAAARSEPGFCMSQRCTSWWDEQPRVVLRNSYSSASTRRSTGWRAATQCRRRACASTAGCQCSSALHLRRPRTGSTQRIGTKSNQHVNICNFAVCCDRRWSNTQ